MWSFVGTVLTKIVPFVISMIEKYQFNRAVRKGVKHIAIERELDHAKKAKYISDDVNKLDHDSLLNRGNRWHRGQRDTE